MTPEDVLYSVAETEPNNLPGNATALLLVPALQGSSQLLGYGSGTQELATPYTNWSDPDYWRIELLAGDLVSVSVNTPDSTLDAYVELRNDVDSSVVFSFDEGPDQDSFISRYEVSATGLYYVVVGKGYLSGGGSYELQVDVARGIDQESDAYYSNGSISGANMLTLVKDGTHQHSAVAGTIMLPENWFDRDVYGLGRLNSGNLVELSTTLPSTSTLVAKVTLLAADGSVVADGDGNSADGHFSATLTVDGEYYAQVDAGEWRYNGHTYMLSSDGMNWSAAKAYAESLGGHLVDINDAGEQQWVAENFAWVNPWIAQNDAADTGLWSGVTASPGAYTNWGPGQPFTSNGENYGYMAPDGLWYAGRDNWGYRALIELETSGTMTKGAGSEARYILDVAVTDMVAPRVESVSLPVNNSTVALIGASITVTLSEKLDPATIVAGDVKVWERDGHFYTLTDGTMSWQAAEAAATVMGGHLVSIHDASEQTWLLAMLDGRFGPVWTGMTDQAEEGVWTLPDGTAIGYSNWASGEPYGQDTSCDYASMQANGQWSANPGSMSLRGLIEFTDADSDDDGLPDKLDPYPLERGNAWDLREAGSDALFDTADDVIHRLWFDAGYSTGTIVKLLIEDGTPGAGSYRFTANMRLTDIVGNELDGDSNGTGGDAFQHFFTIAPPAGVSIEGGRNNLLQTATSLALHEELAVGGLLLGHGTGNQDPAILYSYLSDPDYWRIELLAGDLVSVSVNTPDSALDVYVELRNDTDSQVAHSNDEGQGSDSFISRYEVIASGSYYVLVGKDYSSGGGSYDLQVDVARSIDQESDANYSNGKISSANSLTLVKDGITHQHSTVAGIIMLPEYGFDQDVYALGRLNSGNLVELSTTLPSTSTLVAKVTLLAPDGSVVADGNSADGHFSATLASDGEYYAQVEAGEWRYNGHTYILSSDGMNWSAAKAYAESLGGHLVDINDAGEQQWVAENFAWVNPWIAQNDAADTGLWSGVTASPGAYTNWGPGQPFTSNGENYGYMAPDGLWYAGRDNWGYRALIELETSGTMTKGAGSEARYILDVAVTDMVAPRVESVSLPVNNSTVALIGASITVTLSEKLDPATIVAGDVKVWERDGHFYTLTDGTMSWQAAEAAATVMGGHLVSIHDASEQTWLLAMLDGRFGPVWTGMTDQAEEGVWTLPDGTAIGYSNWASGEPYGQDTSCDYASMQANGQWSANPGSMSLRGLIEFTDADSDDDGLPDKLDPYPLERGNAWDLREAGSDALFDTADDVIHRLWFDAGYSTGTIVKLLIEDGTPGAGSYRFTANMRLTDIVGNELDGDSNGTGGDAFQHFFTIAPPAGVSIEGGRNNLLQTATSLALHEELAVGGLLLGHGTGNQDPAILYSYLSDPDYWRIELLAGDLVSVSVNTDSSLDVYVELRNGADSQVAYSDDEGQGSDSFISRYEVTASGSYYVLVGKGFYSGGGSYDLQVDVARGIDQESDANYSNGSISSANILTLVKDGTHQRSTVAGTIMLPDQGFDQDVYGLGRLNSGNLVELSTALPSTSTLVAKVTLLAADGSVVADGDGNSVDGHFNATMTVDGEYYARVEAGEWRYNGHTYMLSSDGMNWSAAKAYAESLGGHLVDINDAGEQQWVAENFAWVNPWIAQNDAADTGDWSGVAASPGAYTNWGPGQPSTYYDYNYGYMAPDGLWYSGCDNWGYRALIELERSGTMTNGAASAAKYILDVAVIDLVADQPTVLAFMPDDGATAIAVNSSITLSFSEAIQRGIGTIAIHADSPDGDIFESYNAASSTKVSIDGTTLTINPTAELQHGTHYFVSLDSGSIEDMAGNDFAGLHNYDFTTEASLPDFHDLYGTMTFWKNGVALSDVGTTVASVPMETGSEHVEFRNLQQQADGSYAVELWETSAQTDIHGLQLELLVPGGATATWQQSAALPQSWTGVVNNNIAGHVVLAGMGLDSLAAGSLQLGMLRFSAPTNPDNFALTIVTGWIGGEALLPVSVACTSSSTNGFYRLDELLGGQYDLAADNHRPFITQAITVDDALAALKMSVALNPNEDGSVVSPYQYLAADMNHDGKVRATDALHLLKIAAGIENLAGNEWIFVPESVGSEPMSRNNVDWSNADLFVDLSHDTPLDLIGIVSGDVNGSWVA